MITAAILLATAQQIDCANFLERAYGRWVPSELTKTERGIRLRLSEQSGSRRVADLFFDGTSWRQVIPSDLDAARQREFDRERDRKAHCEEVVPYERPDRQTAIALRPHLRVGNTVEEEPAACDERDGVIWFGLGFYEGEGSDGVGGIGQYVPATKQIEVRRPEWLRDKSVDHLAFDGENLWLAVSQHYEQDQQPWGLARYNWNSNEFNRVGEACGFNVKGLLVDNSSLWVATDLALSRLDLVTHRWTNWLPQRDGTLRPGSCRPVYERVMKAATDFWNCEPAFGAADFVARFAPDVARQVILGDRPLHFFNAKAAGIVARNVEELRSMLQGAEQGVAEAAMLAFAERKSSDPRWRDFAFAYAKRTGDVQPLRYFRGDEEIFRYVLSAVKNGPHYRVHRAIEMLPWIGGSRSVQPLLSILDSALATNDGFIAVLSIEALERAEHLRIEADGKAASLAANSDTPEYADEEFGAFMRRDDLNELRKIAAAWHRRIP